MKRTAVGLLVILTLMTGCIVESVPHEQTLQDLQATKINIDRMRVQNEALNRQVKVFPRRKPSCGTTSMSEWRTSGRSARRAGKDRQAVDSKLKDLERQVKDLTASKRMVAQELEVRNGRC